MWQEWTNADRYRDVRIGKRSPERPKTRRADTFKRIYTTFLKAL
jgi:hypothetical protein